MSFYIDFFKGSGTDDKGRTLEEILSFTDNELERVHNYIQRIFPLNEKSYADPTAPLLTEEDIEEFNLNPIIRDNIEVVFSRMLRFYGFKYIDSKIYLAENFSERVSEWITYRNHNYLRITRIIKFLKLVSFDKEAEEFFNILERIYSDKHLGKIIGENTYSYWMDAIEG